MEPAEKGEIVAELAAHLEEVFGELCGRGLSEEEAMRRTMSRVGDWRDLRRKIVDAKRRGPFMTSRIRQLWIPGFLTLVLSMTFLTVLQKLGFQPRVVWTGPSSILLYSPWLFSLPVFGALAAYVSSRAGGSRGIAVLASVFPALALTGAFLVMSPIGMAIERITGRHNDFGVVAATLLKDGIGWLLVPAVALLVGGMLAQLSPSSRPSSRQTAIG